METMQLIVFFSMALLAAYIGRCPRGGRPPCPDPLGKTVFWGFSTGAIAGAAYLFLFVGKRALECCDLIAVVILAYLLSVFIHTLFSANRES